MTADAAHWDDVYRRKGATTVSWFRPRLDASIDLLKQAGFAAGSRVIDVGGGASTLVDDLLAAGAGHVTVIDLAAEALAIARARIGDDPHVAWRVGDIGDVVLEAGAFDLWHDRAVLHFIHEPDALARYAAQAARAVRTGGGAVIGGFAPDGPERCSGLPVARRSAEDIAAILAPAFERAGARVETHVTPAGSPQAFAYALLRGAEAVARRPTCRTDEVAADSDVHRPLPNSRMQSRDTDVLILGGGVIGLACALELAKAGREVTVLEKGAVGSGSSHGNCGTITPSHAPPLAMPGMVRKALGYMLRPDAPFYLKPRLDFTLFAWLLRFARRCNWADFREVTRVKGELLQRSRERLAELVRDDRLECEFEELGTLYAYRDPRELEDGAWLVDALAAIGMRIDVLDGPATRTLEPALNDSIVGGHYNPGDAHLRPDRYVSELARRARELGVRIEADCEVTALRGGERPEADTPRGTFRARKLVFALGAWTSRHARALGIELPVQPGKGYSITFDRPSICPRIPVVGKERSVCVTAWSSGFRLGSTMEFSGYDTSLNRVRLDALTRGAREYLREVPTVVREEWYGWRPMTYDDLPIIGPSQRDPNVVLATGHGMLGVTLSAITGVLVAEIVTGKPTSLDIAPYSPARFA